MHVQHIQESPEFWLQYYKTLISQQNHYQLGSDVPAFIAQSPYQRGGGLGAIFKSIFRWTMPALKSIGRQALVSGSRVVADVVQGRDVKESLKEHARQGVGQLLHKAGDAIQSGQGKKRRKKINKRRALSTHSVSKVKRRKVVGSKKLSDYNDIFLKAIK